MTTILSNGFYQKHETHPKETATPKEWSSLRDALYFQEYTDVFVPLRSLIPADKCREWVDSVLFYEQPVVILLHGKLYIHSGHSQVQDAIKSGKSAIKVHTVHIPTENKR